MYKKGNENFKSKEDKRNLGICGSLPNCTSWNTNDTWAYSILFGACENIARTKTQEDYKTWESTTLSDKYCCSYFGSKTSTFYQGERELKHKPDGGIIEAGVYWEWTFKTSTRSIYKFKIEWDDEKDQQIFIEVYDRNGQIDTLEDAQIFDRGMAFDAENADKIVISTIQKISSSKSSYE